MARHSLDVWLTSELPPPDNRVTLDRDGNIEMRYAPNNEAGHKRLIKTLEHALQQDAIKVYCEVACGSTWSGRLFDLEALHHLPAAHRLHRELS